MKQTVFRRTTILFLVALVTLPARTQTLKQRSDEAYRKLAVAQGRKLVDYQNELAGYRLFDSLDRASWFAEKAMNLSRELNYQTGLFQSLVHLGKYMLIKGQVDSADRISSEALKISENIPIEKGRESAWYNLGRVSLGRNDIKTAIERFGNAAGYAKKNKNYFVAGTAYNRLAECYKLLGNSREFMSNLSQAVDYFKKDPDPLATPGAMINVAINYADAGFINKANEVTLIAIALAEKVGDSITLGYLYSNIAGIFNSHTFPEKALEYNQKALKIFRAVNDYKGISYVLNNIGQYYFSMDDLNHALSYFKEGFALKLKISDWQGSVFTLCNIAEIYMKKKDALTARTVLDEANKVIVKAGDDLSKTVLLSSEGNYYSLINNPVIARNYYQKSLTLARRLKNHGIVLQNLLAISEQYQAEGKDSEALDYYKQYTTIKDSANKENNVQSMAELQLKYESEKSESHFRELLHSKLATVKGQYFVFGNLAMALVLVVLLIVYLRYNDKITAGFLSEFLDQKYPTNKKGEVITGIGQTKNDQASKAVLTSYHQDQIWKELNHLMHSKKLYLNNSLSLGELARKLNTNTTYLSKVINDITGENFSNYLNNLRIKEACRLLSDSANRHLTIEAIAQQVGFNSKSSFNSSFKKITRCTPSEFMSSAKERLTGTNGSY